MAYIANVTSVALDPMDSRVEWSLPWLSTATRSWFRSRLPDRYEADHPLPPDAPAMAGPEVGFFRRGVAVGPGPSLFGGQPCR